MGMMAQSSAEKKQQEEAEAERQKRKAEEAARRAQFIYFQKLLESHGYYADGTDDANGGGWHAPMALPSGEDDGNGGGSFQYSSMSTNTIGQLSFLSGVGLAKEGYSILNSEYMRQARYNNSILKPGFNKEIISSLKVPKSMKFLGEFGGSVFNVFEYYNIEGQYKRGEISKEWMTIEHNSNGIGIIPGIGTAWTLGWETGRIITSIPAYRTYIRNPLRKAVGIDTGN